MRPLFRTITRVPGFLLMLGILAQGQTTQLTPFFRQQFFSNTGAIANGYKVCTYQAGTTTPLATYTDSTGGTPNANPVVLDSTGTGNIWLTPGKGYKLVLRTAGTDSTCSTGTVVQTVDQVFVPSPTGVNSVTVGNAIASAATIAPTAPITHITGTTQITTITAPSQFTQTGYGGCFTLIPDGAWSTGTSGNIAVALTATVSQSIMFCYDNGTSKWYPLAVSGTFVTLVSTTGFSAKGTATLATDANYISSETGANNAIVGALNDANGTAVPQVDGVCVTVKLGHTLQAGANTFAFNGNSAVAIKSHYSGTSNIANAYQAGNQIHLCYNTGGPQWADMAQ